MAIILELQLLGLFGYQSPPEGAEIFQQSAVTIKTIRLLIGPFGVVLLFSSIIFAWFYPLTRDKHSRIRSLLDRRANR